MKTKKVWITRDSMRDYDIWKKEPIYDTDVDQWVGNKSNATAGWLDCFCRKDIKDYLLGYDLSKGEMLCGRIVFKKEKK